MARPKKTTEKTTEKTVEKKPVPDLKKNNSAAEIRKTPAPLPPPEDLNQMIQTAAYFRAQKDGFRMDPGLYWKEAEGEIMARFKSAVK
jgi:hypothetical protein